MARKVMREVAFDPEEFAIQDGAELLIALAETGTSESKFAEARKLLEEREGQGKTATALEVYERLSQTPGVSEFRGPGSTLEKAWALMVNGKTEDLDNKPKLVSVERRMVAARKNVGSKAGGGKKAVEELERRLKLGSKIPDDAAVTSVLQAEREAEAEEAAPKRGGKDLDFVPLVRGHEDAGQLLDHAGDNTTTRPIKHESDTKRDIRSGPEIDDGRERPPLDAPNRPEVTPDPTKGAGGPGVSPPVFDAAGKPMGPARPEELRKPDARPAGKQEGAAEDAGKPGTKTTPEKPADKPTGEKKK